ncbi:hypothetical protein BN2537_16447 [Streptomyces venezuelae]|nr:hypothetical protein BN2537_16447 [Streptomyces venezuelae]
MSRAGCPFTIGGRCSQGHETVAPFAPRRTREHDPLRYVTECY